ncbi:hypothetical protein U9M48_018869 [Paspalum notatum var. saurae]|uniref:Uncharacterized protein n=1 Tax=Paspalum notatum var. saurae TaxID=547442 RepID=A0AAQ3WQ49_PASNO
MKGVILTKDNLKNCNWNGDDGCCFCNKKETIQQVLFGELFNTWFEQVEPNMRPLLCIGASAIVSSIWLCRNDCVFDRKRLYSYLQKYILAKVLESTSKRGRQKLFEVGMLHVREGGFRGVREECLAVI